MADTIVRVYPNGGETRIIIAGVGLLAPSVAQAAASAATATAAATAAASSAVRATPFMLPQTGNPNALIWVRFFTKDAAGVAVTVPATVELREIQIYNGNQLRLRLGEPGVGQFARESGNGTYQVLAGTTGRLIVPVIADTASSGSITRQIGEAEIDLSLITPAAFSATNLARLLDRRKLFQNSTEVTNIATQVKDYVDPYAGVISKFIVPPASTDALFRLKDMTLTGTTEADRIKVRVFARTTTGATIYGIWARYYGTILPFGTGGTSGTGGTGTYKLSAATASPVTGVPLRFGLGTATATVCTILGDTLTVTTMGGGTIAAAHEVNLDVLSLGASGSPVAAPGVSEQTFTLVAMNGSGLGGLVPIDLGSGEVYGSLTDRTYVAGGLRVNRLLISPALTSAITLTATALDTQAAAGAESPFASTADPRLKRLFKAGSAWNLPVRPGGWYIALVEKATGRARVHLADCATQTVICHFVIGDGSGSFDYSTFACANFIKSIKGIIDGGGNFKVSGSQFGFEIADWGAFTTSPTAQTFTPVTGRLKDSVCFTREQTRALRKDGRFAEEVTVGAGDTALQTAAEALYFEGPKSGYTDFTARTCLRSRPDRKVALVAPAGAHKATNLLRCEDVWLVGPSTSPPSAYFIRLADAAAPKVQSNGSGGIWNFGFRQTAGMAADLDQYDFHVDSADVSQAKPDAVFAGVFGTTTLDWITQDNRNLRSIGIAGMASNALGIGGGTSSGCEINFVDCGGTRPYDTSSAFFSFHNGKNHTVGARIVVRRPWMPDRRAEIIAPVAYPSRVPTIWECIECTAYLTSVAITHSLADIDTYMAGLAPVKAVDRLGTGFVGDPGGPIAVSAGMTVMQLGNPADTLTGAGVAAIFGTIGEDGRGDNLLLDGATITSVATVLGNGTVTPKPITKGASTWAGAANYTSGWTWATIVADINTALGAGTVSLVDIGPETVFEVPGIEWADNLSGAVQAHGTAVHWSTGVGYVTAAQGSAYVDAVVMGRHAIGRRGKVNTRNVAVAGIAELNAMADGARFGIGAGGRFSAAEAVKVGQRRGGVAVFFGDGRG